MAKSKTIWVCSSCGGESQQWMGKCTFCGAWDTYYEEKKENINARDGKTKSGRITSNQTEIFKLKDAPKNSYIRKTSGYSEIDRVLGGGFVAGSLTLIGGEPGIGKSTLILQICDKMAKEAEETKVLYISGEESAEQVGLRAERLGISNEGIYFYGETDMSEIEEKILDEKPSLCIIDSIQTVYTPEISSAPGSVSQVREVTARIMNICKKRGITTIIVGHVTKDGNIAGPRVLEHMVDTVLYIEGERYFSYRVLRTVKNRFGSTNEIGMFEMKEEGLVEVDNPSTALIEDRKENTVGTIVVPSVEGTRPILIELQALTTRTIFGMPRRSGSGLDTNKINLLLAVIEKYTNMALSSQDVYMNVVGGIKINEPAVDLGIVLSVVSSYKKIEIKTDIAAVGEVGLTGEIRNVSMLEKRIIESEKLGFKKIIVPKTSYERLDKKFKSTIQIIPVKNIAEAIKAIED